MVQLIDLFKIQRCQLGLFLCQKYDRFAPFFEQRSLFKQVKLRVSVKEFLVEKTEIAFLKITFTLPGIGNAGRGEEQGWLVYIQLMCSVMDGAFSNDKADLIIITAVVRTFETAISSHGNIKMRLSCFKIFSIKCFDLVFTDALVIIFYGFQLITHDG